VKVLIASAFEESGIAGLRAAGCEVSYEPDLAGPSLVDAVRTTGATVLVVRSTPVPASVMDAGSLALIVRAGAGYNTIDVKAASERGIYVSNCPGKNAIAVAELAFALILALDRRIPDNVADLRAGRWDKKTYANAAGLHGRTLGLLGLGSIGREMLRRGRAFGMRLAVWSRRLSALAGSGSLDPVDAELLDDAEIGETPADVAARADVLSVHVAYTPETRHLVDASVLGRLKPGAIFVNTARAEVVDADALEIAVRERGLRVGLDVHDGEPEASRAEFSAPLVSLPGVYGTHHIGASTEQAQEAIAAETVRIIRTYKETGRVPNVVNLATKTPASHRLIVRHRDRPGVLAHVFEHLRASNLNVQETENIIFEGARAAVARINLDGAPSYAVLAAIKAGNRDILDLHLVRI
jgi:D-3-phosphoglycerate dehydrogenase